MRWGRLGYRASGIQKVMGRERDLDPSLLLLTQLGEGMIPSMLLVLGANMLGEVWGGWVRECDRGIE